MFVVTPNENATRQLVVRRITSIMTEFSGTRIKRNEITALYISNNTKL